MNYNLIICDKRHYNRYKQQTQNKRRSILA